MNKPLIKTLLAEFRKILLALSVTAAITAVMLGLVRLAGLNHGAVIYVIPVIVAAIRWGVVAAVAAAIAGVGASAFFFYPPIYDFRVSDPDQVLDLVLFIFVAIVTSHLASQLSEARVRAKTDLLRQALIDSVSHELRTPLVSILGAATVLYDAPALAGNPHLKELAYVIREEAERLNNDIQNLLDATRISSEGIHPRLEWTELADIVNSALDRCRRRLAHHRLELDFPGDLPLIQVDSVLVQQALVQVLDNAGKYSPPDSSIFVSLRAATDAVRIVVSDTGAGLTDEERTRLWDRFFRGDRHTALVTGSGLGLWIAKAFVAANGGTLIASSQGVGRGTTITIELPTATDEMLKGGMSGEDSDG